MLSGIDDNLDENGWPQNVFKGSAAPAEPGGHEARYWDCRCDRGINRHGNGAGRFNKGTWAWALSDMVLVLSRGPFD